MNEEFVLQLRKSGRTAEEAERAIKRGLSFGITNSAALTAQATHWMRYFYYDNPDEAEYAEALAKRDGECKARFLKMDAEADKLIRALRKQQGGRTRKTTEAGRHKSTKRLWLMSDHDAVPENKRVAVMDAVLKASGCKPGQGDKPNIRLLGDMGMLFLDFHLEGMAIPRTCGDKRHLKDGRLMDLLEQHGRLKDTTEASTKHNKRLMTKAANEILPAILAVINADS